MSFNIVQTIIAIAVNGLIAYGLYSFNRGDNTLLLGIGSFFMLVIPAVVSMGMRLKNDRASANVRVLAGIFYPLLLVINLIFTFIRFNQVPYILTNGIIMLLFISLAYGIGKAKQ